MNKNKNKKPEEQWIELKELNSHDKVYAANLDDNQLIYGENQQIQQQNNKKSTAVNSTQKQSDRKPQPIENVQKKEQPVQFRQPPSNINQQRSPNNVRTQNPYNQYQKGNPNQQQAQRSRIPTMKVACDHCTLQQNVPGNAQIYVCSACNNINQCYPLYGLFICGSCKAQVCYGFGTSQFIRCTRCGMVNKVPSEPILKYKKGEKSQNIRRQPVQNRQLGRQKQKKHQVIIPVNMKPEAKSIRNQQKQTQYVDFFGDQECMAEMPQKPRQFDQEMRGQELLRNENNYNQLNDIVFTEALNQSQIVRKTEEIVNSQSFQQKKQMKHQVQEQHQF